MRRLEAMKKIILMGHGLGGLIAILFSERHHSSIDALGLNSPLIGVNKLWTDYSSSKRGWFGSKGDPNSQLHNFSQLYHESLHKHQKGSEWEWDINLKPINGFPLYLGWMEMIEEQIARIQTGLNIQIPVFVMVSVKSVIATSWTDDLKTQDAVLDIEKVITALPKLSPFVKIVLVKDGVHDLFLSKEEAKKEAYEQLFSHCNGIFQNREEEVYEDDPPLEEDIHFDDDY